VTYRIWRRILFGEEGEGGRVPRVGRGTRKGHGITRGSLGVAGDRA
jgi:hypothetical protein